MMIERGKKMNGRYVPSAAEQLVSLVRIIARQEVGDPSSSIEDAASHIKVSPSPLTHDCTNAETQAVVRLLTIEQVAEALQISSRSVRRLIDQGELPIVRMHRSVRISPKDLARFIKKSTDSK